MTGILLCSYECFTITLHFTFTGRQYDGTGNLQQWWSNASITNFKERADCMTNQYSSYTVEEAGKKVLHNIIFICDINVHVLQYLQKKIIFFWSTIICCLFKTFEFYFFICYFYSKRVRNCDKANLSHVKKHPFSVENQALAEHLSILASYFDILCVNDHLLISYVNSHVQNTSINFIWNIKCLEIQCGNNKV